VPEGNTVWVTARTLRQALSGRVLTQAQLRIGDLSTVDLTGQQVTTVIPRGKHILIRLDSGTSLHTHLRMDGAWRIHPAGFAAGLARDDVRIVLGNDERTAVGYRIHDIELLPTNAEATVVGHLGPDLLGPDWDTDVAATRLAADPDRAVGEALLDQRNLAGIGNVFKCEICFLRGISPTTPMREVNVAEVVALARRLLVANRERLDQVTTGDTRAGHRTWVYDRAGRPCRRCGTPISMAWQGEPARVTYWCPKCQP
jgi:formamidopyrimidine-DNA glycosylase